MLLDCLASETMCLYILCSVFLDGGAAFVYPSILQAEGSKLEDSHEKVLSGWLGLDWLAYKIPFQKENEQKYL